MCNDGLSAEAVGLLSEILLKDSVPLLKLLHFYNNMSGDEGAKNMSTILTACPTIEDLRFSATRSGNAGCLKIAEAIGTITSLTKLDLMDNTFGTVAADKLGHSLLRHVIIFIFFHLFYSIPLISPHLLIVYIDSITIFKSS